MENKWLTIPKNEKGIEEYDYGVETSENLISLTIPEKEFKDLWSIFDSINDKYDVCIDDFESELIPAYMIDDVLELVSIEKYPTFNKALRLAKQYGTFIALDF